MGCDNGVWQKARENLLTLFFYIFIKVLPHSNSQWYKFWMGDIWAWNLNNNTKRPFSHDIFSKGMALLVLLSSFLFFILLHSQMVVHWAGCQSCMGPRGTLFYPVRKDNSARHKTMRDYFVDESNVTAMCTEFKEDVTIYLWSNLWDFYKGRVGCDFRWRAVKDTLYWNAKQ